MKNGITKLLPIAKVPFSLPSFESVVTEARGPVETTYVTHSDVKQQSKLWFLNPNQWLCRICGIASSN